MERFLDGSGMLSRVRTRILAPLFLLTFLASACSPDDSVDTSPEGSVGESDTAAVGPEGSSEGGSGDDDPLANHAGLCAWVSPEQLEEIFGGPMDAVSLGGNSECRIVAEENFDVAGIYHLKLDQSVGFDEYIDRVETNSRSAGFEICDREQSRWQGMRVLRIATCPGTSTGVGHQPGIYLEIEPGRVMVDMPFAAENKEEAVAAGHRFVEVAKAFAVNLRGLPMINEVMPGGWLELYNPAGNAVDLTGYRIVGVDDRDESIEPGSIDVPAGTTIPSSGHVVVDLTGLAGVSGGDPEIHLVGPEGRVVDVSQLGEVDPGPDEVARRNGDGGPHCLSPSTRVTKGAPNPAMERFCGA